jgi:hypothetical protein
MKRALRNAAKRCDAAPDTTRREAIVYDTGVIVGASLIARLTPSTERVINLDIEGVVFIPRLAQFGIVYENKATAADVVEYIPVTAEKMVTALTDDVKDGDTAFSILEPYFKAVMNLP